MSEKIITLSGAATDVLYSLFFRGALQSGDLPAKSGAAELRELGLAETRHTATEYQKQNYFTFLTAEGQKFAIKHLADTRFGKPVDNQYRSAITIGVDLDTSGAQKALDELDDKIRNSDAFKVMKDGWSHEKNGTMIINNGQVFICDAMNTVTVRVGKFGNTGVDTNLDDIIKNALASHAAIQQIRKDLATVVEDEIAKNLKPGGTIWDCLRRGI